jgi:hypothetical protein
MTKLILLVATLTACSGSGFVASDLTPATTPDAAALATAQPDSGAPVYQVDAAPTDLSSLMTLSAGNEPIVNLSHGWVYCHVGPPPNDHAWACPQASACYCPYDGGDPNPFLRCLLQCGC